MKATRPNGWLTVAEAAPLLATSQTTIRTWATRGCPVAGHVVKLGAECVGVRFYFTGESIERFKADCAAARQAEAEAADANADRFANVKPSAPGAATAAGLAALARL